MRKYEAEEFANYEVYELVGEEKKYHCLCVCKDMDIACAIAKCLAFMDKSNDSYYVTSVDVPGTLTWGGGWYYEYHKDENGKLRQSSLM